MTRQGNLIGKQLSKLRNAENISQAELAARCQRLGWDLSRDVLARIEGGIRGVSDKELVLLCFALKVTVQELLTPTLAANFVKGQR
jgi:transcriptional regulator with XRE-family HTH domain